MPKYLTPGGYRRRDDGVPGALALTDMLLAQYIARAEAAVDAYMGFDLLQGGGFEPHSTGLTSSGFDFTTRKFRLPLPPVPLRSIDRIRVHISNAGGNGGQGLYAVLSPGEVVFNQYDQYAEIIALTLTYSLSAVVWELGLNPPILEVDAQVGYYLPKFGEQLYDIGDGKTFYGLSQFWATTYTQAVSNQPNTLPPVPPTIYVNGVPALSTDYVLNPTEGSVVFAGSQAGNTITADVTRQIPQVVAEATTAQVSYLLTQRSLNMRGAGGLEQVRSGDQFIRRARQDDVEEDGLCARARLKLQGYKSIAIA